MKIFITAATGVLGKRVVKLLIDEGYQLLRHTRSKNSAIRRRDLNA